MKSAIKTVTPATKPWYKRLGIMNVVMLLVNLAFALAGLVMVIDLNSRDAWGVFLFFWWLCFLLGLLHVGSIKACPA